MPPNWEAPRRYSFIGSVFSRCFLFCPVLLIQNFSVNGDGDYLPRNELSAGLQCLFCRHLQTAAAGHLHAEDGHALDVVAAQDLSELFAVIHSVQLRAADEGHLAAHKLLMEIGVGVCRAVRRDQELCALKVGRMDRSQLDLHRPVAQASNLIFFIPTSISATIFNIKRKQIKWNLALPIAIWGSIGAAFGAFLATKIETGILKKLFGVFLILIAIFESYSWYNKYIKKT